MSDNTVLNLGVGGDTIIDEQIGLAKMPVSKIRLGGYGVDDGDVTDANPFPVKIPAGFLSVDQGTAGVDPWPVDGSGVTQPVSAASLPLPSGASTAAKQDTGNVSLASIDTKLTSPLAVTGPLTDTQLRAVAVPVSAAALPLPAGAATSAKQDTGNASLASIDTKLTAPLSVLGPLTNTELRAVAVPVSAASLPLPTGASTAARQDTGNASLSSIDTKLTAPLTVTGPLTDTQLRASAVPVSASSLPLPTGAATSAKQDTGNTSLASIDTKLTSPLTVTGPLTDTQLRATPVPVSAASLPLPAGAATSAKQDTGNTSLASIDTKLTSPLSVTGPLTDTQLRATAVPVSAASLPLPTGAATETTLATLLTGAAFTGRINTQGQKTMAASTPVVVASDQSSLPVTVGNFPATQPVSGTVTANQGTAGVTAWPVDGSGVTQPTTAKAQTAYLDAGNSTTTPLGASSTFTGTGIDVSGYASTRVVAFTNADSLLYAQYSQNNVNWDDAATANVVSANVTTVVSIKPRARYMRAVVNSFDPQSVLRLQTFHCPETQADQFGADFLTGAQSPLATDYNVYNTYQAVLSLGTSLTQIYSALAKPTAGTVTVVAAAVLLGNGYPLLTTNSLRRGATIFNDAPGSLYISLASTLGIHNMTNGYFSTVIPPGGTYEVPFGYTGDVMGGWEKAVGAARITELT